MLIKEKSKYGRTLSEINEYKIRITASYAKFNKEIFGIKIDEDSTLENSSCGVTNMEKYFLDLLNDSLKEEGSEIRLSSLDIDLKEQIANHFANKTKQLALSVLEDSIEFLCSQTGASEETIKNKFMDEIISQVSEEFESDCVESCKIEQLLVAEKEFEKEMEQEVKSLLDIIETEKNNIRQKNATKKEEVVEEVKQEEKTTASNNFVKPESENVIDAEYVDITSMNESDIKDLKNKIEECVNYYYNADRIAMMVGGNKNVVTEVMNNIMTIVNKMDDLVNNATAKDNKIDISNKLSEMQLEISSMINSFNPNISKGSNIINSFKAVEVGVDGEPIRVEDFFGKQYETKDFINDNSIEQENYRIFAKYPDLYNIVIAIQQQTGSFIKLEEVKSSYKYMNPILKASVMMNNSETNRYFYIDLNGTLYNDKSKFVILNKSEIIDEGYYISTSRIDLITKYIFGTLSEEELESNDLLSFHIREINKLIDLSSINKENKQFIINVMIQKPSMDLLIKAVKFDKQCRFRLDKINGNTFSLISDSKTKKYFNGPSCRRKKQTMSFKDGELILDGKQE